MTERFYGTVTLGGQVTQEQFAKCLELLDPCLEMDGELDDDGSAHFHECTTEDFVELVEYCKANSIALSIQWYAKYEYAGRIECFIAGNYREFECNNNGQITIPVADLATHSIKTPYMTIEQYIDALDIPDFPEFSIIEDTPKRTVKVFYSSGDIITAYIDGTNDEIVDRYLSKSFQDTQHIALCVHIDDKNGGTHGLTVRNIENDETGRVASVRRETVKIDDTKSYDEIMLTLYSGDECALNDAWVYDRQGEWINAIGYRHETVRR